MEDKPEYPVSNEAPNLTPSDETIQLVPLEEMQPTEGGVVLSEIQPENSPGSTSSTFKKSREMLHELKKELKTLRERVTQQDIRIFEMRALLQSGKGLSNILNLSQLLDTFMSVVRERYGVINSSVLLRDELENNKEYYQVKRFFGLDPTYTDHKGRREPLYLFRIQKDDGLLWQIVLQGNVFSVRDLQKEPRFLNAWEKWNLDTLHSDIWIPLIKSGEILGILTLGQKTDGTQIPESEFSFAQELAAIATTIIDSTLKYEKNQRILTNIQTLYDVNQELANINDFKALCKETLKNAVKAVHAQKGNLMLFNRTTGKLELRVMWGHIRENVIDRLNQGLMESKTFDIGEGIAGKAAQTRKPIVVNNRDEIPQNGPYEVFCISSIPVINGTQLEGVMNFTNKVKLDENQKWVVDQLGRFNKDDLSLLQGLADQSGTSLHKARLYTASITDRLTGLYNNRHFEETYAIKLEEAIAEQKPMCIGVSDIDHFKKFNDTYGHKAGDLVLKHVAQIFNQVVRPPRADAPGVEPESIQKFRYGGEEFCMILPNTTNEEAYAILENFRDQIEKTAVDYEGKTLKVTVSIGIACSATDSQDGKELFNAADECLYACKEGGRNQVRAYLQGKKARLDGKESIPTPKTPKAA